MHPDTFVRWAMDDCRTIEERYTVELLIERCHGRWHFMHQRPFRHDMNAVMEHRRQRKLNPAYEPRYTEEVLRRITEVFPEVTSWSPPSTYDDRPQREFTALRFLPNLTQLNLNGEFTDLSPLLDMPQVRSLGFYSPVLEDLRLLGRCVQLRHLGLTLGVNWPDVRGLEALTQLETLSLTGNLLAFERGVTFPNVVSGTLICAPLAARSVRDLPQLPACRMLTLNGVEKLDGIEAFPQLRNLTLSGDVQDYSPLAALGELTCLNSAGAKPLDVTPLTRVPKLAYAAFTFNYKWSHVPAVPRDYSPLVEAPALRQIDVPGCEPVVTEVAALNAVLNPWDELFALTPPRPLPPLRIISAPLDKHPRPPEVHLMPGESLPIDEQLRRCEARWAGRKVERAIHRRLAARDWGRVETQDHLSRARHVTVNIESYAVVEKIGDIVQAARETIAGIAPEYTVHFHIDLKAPRPEPTPAQIALEEQFEREQDEFNFEKRQRERAEYLDRLHRFQLKKQEGSKVKPEDFSVPPPEPPPAAPWEREDDDNDDEDEDAGDFAIKQKLEPPPSWLDDEHPLAHQYRMWGVLTLTELWLSGDAGLVLFCVGRAPDTVIEREKRD